MGYFASFFFPIFFVQAGRDAKGLLTFGELRDVVGFNDYYEEEERYKLK